MKRLVLFCAFPALALSLLPATARGQVQMSIQIGLPVAPPLVVVQPGLQVVENSDEEVFFVDGWYWCRRDGSWYRAQGPQARFAYVEPQRVPYQLAYLPPSGHYRRWGREQLGEERQWWEAHDRDRRRAWEAHQNPAPRGVVESPAPPPGVPQPRVVPAAQPPPAAPTREVISAKHIEASRVRARVIYAKHVEAAGGRVGRVLVERGGKQGGPHIQTDQVSADTIYVEHLQADWIEAAEIHAEHARIGQQEFH